MIGGGWKGEAGAFAVSRRRDPHCVCGGTGWGKGRMAGGSLAR